MDILLSSGFLAFARHIGFRKAVLEKNISVDAICGTSSGAVVGALWANGMSEADMLQLLHEPKPIRQLNWNWKMWEGLFHFAQFRSILAEHLPKNIEDLPIPFAVGVCTMERKSVLLTKGPLVEAISASCSIPYIFQPVSIADERYRDGGFADRIAAKSWKEFRPNNEYIAHIVDRSNGVPDEVGLDNVHIVRTPRSFASLFSMGDFPGQFEESYALSLQQLAHMYNTV